MKKKMALNLTLKKFLHNIYTHEYIFKMLNLSLCRGKEIERLQIPKLVGRRKKLILEKKETRRKSRGKKKISQQEKKQNEECGEKGAKPSKRCRIVYFDCSI